MTVLELIRRLQEQEPSAEVFYYNDLEEFETVKYVTEDDEGNVCLSDFL